EAIFVKSTLFAQPVMVMLPETNRRVSAGDSGLFALTENWLDCWSRLGAISGTIDAEGCPGEPGNDSYEGKEKTPKNEEDEHRYLRSHFVNRSDKSFERVIARNFTVAPGPCDRLLAAVRRWLGMPSSTSQRKWRSSGSGPLWQSK